MMNKKAIAAFAAGATLFAGFAMATPAFAGADTAAKTAETKVDPAAKAQRIKEIKEQLPMVEKQINALENGDEGVAYGNEMLYSSAVVVEFDKAQQTLGEADSAVTKASSDYDAVRALFVSDSANAGKTFTTDNTVKFKFENGAWKKDDSGDVTGKSLDTALEAAQTNYAAAQDAFNKASAKRDAFNARYNAVVAERNKLKAELDVLEGRKPAPTPTPTPDHTKPDHTKPDHTTPVQPAKPGSKLEAVKNVLAKKVDVDAASHVFAEKKEAYTKAAATLTAAKAELDAAEHDKAVAAQNLSDFEASGVNDSAKLKSLQEAVARADAHVVRTTNAFNKALADFNDAKTADLAAQAAYNAAKDAYDEAYNAAIKLGVNPALLPSVTAVDPLSPAFPQLAQAQKIYADALAGKFGAAAQKAVQKAEAKAQAAAPAAAAGKAGAAAGKAAAAKGELATKGGNGHGKAGEKLGNAGVGVALTALAASMLAGMGAAVRKMRH
ncbi:hypothetical protein [Gardnerella vaginalis]|uniref:hypothetical protein n=1 Tax=Gardnerella vaginalis TaxID=2702 RepID=UPI0039EEF837